MSITHHQLSVSHNLSEVQEVIIASFLSSSQTFSSAGSSTGNIKARFENIAKEKEEEDRKKAEEERVRRQAKEQQEQEAARRKNEEAAKAQPSVPSVAVQSAPVCEVRVLLS